MQRSKLNNNQFWHKNTPKTTQHGLVLGINSMIPADSKLHIE
jgi:hypothetical protein